jgi:FkbM family methyltransferase
VNVTNYLRMARNAHRIGIPFLRRSTFRVPSVVHFKETTIPLSFPQETGIKGDFISCVLRDEYGVWSAPTQTSSIVDIGANVGFFSVWARRRFPNATIHAYEPNPRAVEYLRANCEKLKIEVFPEAVGATAGFVSIVDVGDSNQARIRSNGPGDIRQISLCDVLSRAGGQIDLLKVDCEGGEWNMFDDPSPWREVSHLRMEYHLWGVRERREIFVVLEALGFDVWRHWPSSEWGIVWAKNRMPRPPKAKLQ